jgi:hypothetical protein
VIGRISIILRGIEGKPPLSLLESIALIEAKGEQLIDQHQFVRQPHRS